MLILLFSVHFRLLPTGGDDDIPKSLVLPMVVLFMRPFAAELPARQGNDDR